MSETMDRIKSKIDSARERGLNLRVSEQVIADLQQLHPNLNVEAEFEDAVDRQIALFDSVKNGVPFDEALKTSMSGG